MAKRSRRRTPPPERPGSAVTPPTRPSSAVRALQGLRSTGPALASYLRRHRILLLLIAIAAVLRFAFLGRQDLWVDEFNTYYDALNLDNKTPLTRHHYLAFFFYRIALFIQDSPFSLRFPSALAGTLVLIPFYALMRHGMKKPQALILTALLAFMPFNIHYSMEARYYSFLFLFSVMAMLCLARFCLHGSLAGLILFFACEGAAVLCHPAAGAVAVGASLALAVWLCLRPKWWWRRFTARFGAYRGRYGPTLVWTFTVLELAILTGVLIVGAYMAHRLVFVHLARMWNQPLPEGISPSIRFVWNHFFRFARGRWALSPIPAGRIGGALALLGLALAWWRYRFFGVLFTSMYIGGLGTLFVARAEIAYTVKYSAALAPVVLALMGITIVELGRLIAWCLTFWLGRGRGPAFWGAGLAAIMILLWSPSLYLHYTGQLMPLREPLRYVDEKSEDGLRPCLATQGMTNFCYLYYVSSQTASLFGINLYTEKWPRQALVGFMDSLANSRIPTWACVFRFDYDRGATPTKDGRWSQPVVFKALTPDYDVLLFRRLPDREDEPNPVYSESTGYRYRASRFDNIRPRWAGVTGEGENRALVAVSMVSAEYEVAGTGAPLTFIDLVGRNVSASTRLVEVRIDREPAAVVAFPPKQDQPTTRTIVVPLPKEGKSVLSLTVLDSTLPVNYAATYEADRMELYTFSLRPVPPRRRDDVIQTASVLVGRTFARLTGAVAQGILSDPERPGFLAPQWTIEPRDLPVRVHTDPDSGKEMISLSIDRNSTGGGIVTPAFPVRGGEVVYDSIDVRAEDLDTHSANVRIEFYDAQMQRLGLRYACNRPFHGDEPWRRTTVFAMAPTNAACYAYVFDFWKATEPERMVSGTLHLRNLRSEWPPKPPAQSPAQ